MDICKREELQELIMNLQGGSEIKNLPASAGDPSDSWVGKTPWRRKWRPAPVFLPGKSCGQRSLAGYGLWCHKESDMHEQLSTCK